MDIVLSGSGSALPQKKLTNDELSKIVYTSDEWIRSRTGIGSRHICEKEESLSFLASAAAKKALEMAESSKDEIELIVAGTSSSDRNFPGCACEVQALIEAKQAVCFDVSAACSGFIYAMHIADSMMRASGYKKALVIGADALSRHIDWSDRTTCVLFGDGAAAAVLTAGEFGGRGILAAKLGSDGNKGSVLTCGSIKEDKLLYMDGSEVFKFATRKVPENMLEVINQSGLSKEDIKLFILHQANERIIQKVAKRLDLPLEKFPMNLEYTGNTSGASVPLLLDELIREGRIKKGDNVLLSGFGAGLTWGALIFRY